MVLRRDPAFAAVVVVAATGCGQLLGLDDPQGGVDAGSPDAEVAGPPDAIPRGTVDVTVFSQFGPGVPQSGVTVVFVEPDGTLAARVLSDGDGKASATLTSGGSVTMARLGISTSLVTILAVEAGDHLLFGAPPEDDSTVTQTVAVTFPRTALPHTRLRTTCGSSSDVPAPGTVASMPMQRGCDHTPRDLILEASSDDGTSTLYNVLLGQSGASVSAPESGWKPGDTGQLMLTAVPAEVKSVNAVRFLRSGGRDMFFSFLPSAVDTAGRAAFMVPIEPALLAGDDMLVVTRFFGDPAIGPAQIVRERDTVNASHGVDVASALIPWVYGTKLDVATRTLRWTQTGTGEIDAMVADLGYSRTEGDSDHLFSWRVVAPTSNGMLVLPDLPPELGDIEPKAGDAVVGHAAVYLIRHGDETYAQLRQHLDRDASIFNTNANTPLSTRLTVSEFVCGRGCSIPTPP